MLAELEETLERCTASGGEYLEGDKARWLLSKLENDLCELFGILTDRRRVGGAACRLATQVLCGVEEYVTLCSAGAHSGTGRQHIHIMCHYSVWRRVV